MKQLNWYQIFGNTHKIPDGRTVEPTDDIQIWLHCANIWDKLYTTLAEVLADTDTLLALITSNNAVDYMVRSTTWAVAQALVPIMTDNTHPSGVASASSEDSGYDAYKAFDGDSTTMWYSAIPLEKNYLNYDFGKKVSVSKSSLTIGSSGSGYRYITSIAGSDDGVTYTDLTSPYTFPTSANGTHEETFSPVSYRYYRAYSSRYGFSTSNGTINELQFYSPSIADNATAMTYIGQNNYAANTLIADETWCEALANSEYAKSVFNIYVPIMTDNTHPSGVASASSIYAGDVSNYGAWRAFDGNDVGGTPLASTQQASHGWFQYQFTEPVIIKAVHYKGQDSLWSSRNPSGYLQGSNDGANYDNIKAVNYMSAQVVNDAIENTNSYNRYRFYNSSSSSEYLTAATIQFYGRKDV